MADRRPRGGAVTPDPEPTPTVLHKYKWRITSTDTYCYTDLSRKEIRNLTGSYPKTPAYLESTSNIRINAANSDAVLLSTDGCVWKYNNTDCKLGEEGGVYPTYALTYFGNILYPSNPLIDG